MSAPLPPILSKMPWNIKQEIIDCSEKQMKPTIRQLNKEFKYLVDNSAINYYKLYVEMVKESSEDVVYIGLEKEMPKYLREDYDVFNENEEEEENRLQVEFHHDKNGYRVVKANLEGKVVKVPGKKGEFPFINRAALHLAKFLKNPKLKLKNLRIKVHSPPNRNYKTRMVRQFELRKDALLRKLAETFSNHQLRVRLLETDIGTSQDDILTVLQCVKPKTLNNIWLGDMRQAITIQPRTPIPINIDRIAQTEQWKEAKNLWIRGYTSSEPFSSFSHFDNWTAHISHLTLEEFKEMLQKHASNPSFETAQIKCFNYDYAAFSTYLSQFPTHTLQDFDFKIPIDDSFVFCSHTGAFITISKNPDSL